MAKPRTLLVALVVIAACAVAIALQLGPVASDDEGAITPLAMGEALVVDFTLQDAGSPPIARNVMSWFGSTATVLYTWSVPCPCVDQVEPRLRALQAKLGGEKAGIAWIALAGEPDDPADEVRAKYERLGGFYHLVLDPEQRICRRIGLLHATMVAVLDGEGRLVYRGAIDGDYVEGKAEFLAEALAAVARGEAPPVAERPWVYGCEFAVPESCFEYEPAAGAPPPPGE
jgi:hypothetical protein